MKSESNTQPNHPQKLPESNSDNKNSEEIRVLHLDTETGLRGGEKQMLYVIQKNSKFQTEESAKDNIQIESGHSRHRSQLSNSEPPKDGTRPIRYYFAGQPSGKAIEAARPHCTVFPLKMTGGADVFAAKKLASICKRYRIDIVDAQTSNAHSTALLAKLFGGKFQLIVHRRVDNVPSSSFINRLKYGSSLVDQYVCISNAIAKIMTDFGISEQKIGTVPSAVESAYMHSSFESKKDEKRKVAAHFEIPTNKVWCICAGAFTEQKGHETLIKAWAALNEEVRKGAILLLAGDGPLLEEHKRLAGELSVAGSIHFLGWQRSVDSLLYASDIYTMPSNWEGLGTVFLSAGLCLLPSIATRVGGIPEVIDHEKTGYLVEVKDVQGFARHLEQLIEDKETTKKMAHQARAKVKRDFSLQAMIEGNESIYRKLCSISNKTSL